jgi:hypothetical protein
MGMLVLTADLTKAPGDFEFNRTVFAFLEAFPEPLRLPSYE